MDSTSQARPLSPTRRKVVKGAAWTVPVIVLASAAPVVAASVLAVSVSLTVCRRGDTLRIRVTVTNPNTVDADVTISGVTLAGITAPVTPAGASVTVPAGDVADVIVTVPRGSLAAGDSVTLGVNYTVAAGGTTTTGSTSSTLTILGNGACPF